MAWFLLLLAGVFEIAWTYTLKASDGFSKPIYVVAMLISLVASTWLLSIVVKSLPLGTAYAVWVGIGIMGTTVLGVVLFNESVTPARMGAMALIIIGVVSLNLLES